MSEERMLLHADEADKLLASADGRAALLYLHILRSGAFSVTAAAGVLRCSEAEVTRAADTLRRLGLMEKPSAPLRQTEFPPVKTEDIVARAETDSAFQGIVCEAEKTLGRVLSAHDLELLFGIYDHLGLPADVVMLLLHHCVEEYQARSGPGRMPTMRYIEKEGWHWAELEIMNLDTAEAHLRRCRERREAAAQVKEALQIRGRDLTATERKYVESWLAMGFDEAVIAIAYDRTVSRTGKLAWNYMDKIIRSWNEKQLYTPEAIAAEDPMQRTKYAAEVPVDKSKQMKNLQKLYERLSGQEES